MILNILKFPEDLIGSYLVLFRLMFERIRLFKYERINKNIFKRNLG